MEKFRKKLYIDAGTVIINLLKEEKSEYLSLDRLDKLVSYIYEQLLQKDLVKKYQDIVFDVNFEAVERTVLYNNYLFELIGDTILLKCSEIPDDIVEKYKPEQCVEYIIRQFVAEYAA